jgi:transcriptional regulator with XRE-family HTH domain
MNSDHAFYAEVGHRIKRARETLGITQEALASLVSLCRTSITNIEKGRQKLLLHTFVDFVAALQVTPAELLPDSESHLQQVLDELLKDHSVKERDWVKSTITSQRKRR